MFDPIRSSQVAQRRSLKPHLVPGCPAWSNDLDEHNALAGADSTRELIATLVVRFRSAMPNESIVRDFHRQLFRSTVPLAYYAGNFRQQDFRRPCLAQNVRVGSVLGKPFQEVLSSIDSLFAQITVALRSFEKSWNDLSVSDRAARFATLVGIAVGEFIRIHPFLNGNGRTSRFIWEGLFYRLGLPPQYAVIRRPGAPYDQVMGQAMLGNFGPIIAVVLQATAALPLSRPI